MSPEVSERSFEVAIQCAAPTRPGRLRRFTDAPFQINGGPFESIGRAESTLFAYSKADALTHESFHPALVLQDPPRKHGVVLLDVAVWKVLQTPDAFLF